MKTVSTLLLALLLVASPRRSDADDFAARCGDRTAIERVYHAHRIGTTQTFEQAMPRELIERLVREEMKKEAVLRQVYGMEITPTMVAAEVERINTTTRAPEMLAEIKQSLGGNAARFAAGMARPILVERELRARFENDDQLHTAQRREAEQARASLIAKKPVAGMREITWQLTARPPEHKPAAPASPPPATGAKTSSKSYSNEATARLSQTISSPDRTAPEIEKLYFEDLDPELQKVLRIQLQKPGDVSAVIETPGGFLLFLTREKSPENLTVASLSIPRRSYEAWLAQQQP